MCVIIYARILWIFAAKFNSNVEICHAKLYVKFVKTKISEEMLLIPDNCSEQKLIRGDYMPWFFCTILSKILNRTPTAMYTTWPVLKTAVFLSTPYNGRFAEEIWI